MNNPFLEDVTKWKVNLCYQESLLEMCCDTTLLLRHKKWIIVSILDISWKRISVS